MDQFIAA
jgi:membrane protease subunit (stomatin/prohibitin family)